MNPSVKANEEYRAIVDVLEEEGIEHRVESGGKHPAVCYEIGGRKIRQVFSASPSDHRGSLNAATFTRRSIRDADEVASAGLAFEPQEIDGEPRVLDVALGRALGMAQPLNIRSKIIAVHRDELEAFGEIVVVEEATGGRPGRAHWLNEHQAILVCILSRTQRAKLVRNDVVRVFAERRRSETRPTDASSDPRAGNDYLALHAQIIAQMEEMRAAQDILLDEVASLRRAVATVGQTPSAGIWSDLLTGAQAAALAGLEPARGTAGRVTCELLRLAREKNAPALRTPSDLNPTRPWRFDAGLVEEWLARRTERA